MKAHDDKIASAQYPTSYCIHPEHWNHTENGCMTAVVAEQAAILVFPEYGTMKLAEYFSKANTAGFTTNWAIADNLSRGLQMLRDDGSI